MTPTIIDLQPLTEAQLEKAIEIGRRRNEKSYYSVMVPDYPPDEAEEKNIDAVIAEFSVAEHLNVPPDLEVKEPGEKRKRYDLIWGTQKIDVKWRENPNADLLVPVYELTPDVRYYLVRGTHPHLQLVGCIDGSLVEGQGVYHESPKGDFWCVDWELLEDPPRRVS